MASALDAAHAHGLVHRDIEPANVLLAPTGGGDHAFLTDFGLTKRVEGTERLTQTGQWIGTLDYASPRWRSDPRDRPHDRGRRADSRDGRPAPASSTGRPGPPETGRRGAAGPPAHPLALLAGVVVLVVAVLALTSLLGGDDDGDALKATSFEVKSIAAGKSPSGLAFGEGAAWVALDETETIRRLDPDKGDPGPPIKIGEGVDGKLAIGEGAVWVRSGSGTITKVDAESGQIQGNPIEIGAGSGGDIEVGEDAVWAANTLDGSLIRVDPGTGAVKGKATLPAGANGSLAVGEGAVWVVNQERPTATEAPTCARRARAKRAALPRFTEGSWSPSAPKSFACRAFRPARRSSPRE
ncbi:hypothetical protein BH20ACT18_BH20ACT18_13800 [soil metagenome]